MTPGAKGYPASMGRYGRSLDAQEMAAVQAHLAAHGATRIPRGQRAFNAVDGWLKRQEARKADECLDD